MTPVEFRIKFTAAFGFTPDLPRAAIVTTRPKWRVLDFAFQRGADNAYDMVVRIHPADLTPKSASLYELRAFRDNCLAMLAMTAAVPVVPLNQGAITFPLGDGKFQVMSLGPGQMIAPMVPIPSLAALAAGPTAPDAVQAAAYFLWQALNADLPLYRFINLAVCAQIIANADSSAPKSAHPRCGNPACSFELEVCPDCKKKWMIPTPLRDHLRGIITDEKTLTEFIAVRNAVFHGSLAALLGNQPVRLREINKPLLLILRNVIGSKFGLQPMRAEELPLPFPGVEIFDPTISIFYEMPGSKQHDTGTLPGELEMRLEQVARELQLSGLSVDQVRQEMHKAVDRLT